MSQGDSIIDNYKYGRWRRMGLSRLGLGKLWARDSTRHPGLVESYQHVLSQIRGALSLLCRLDFDGRRELAPLVGLTHQVPPLRTVPLRGFAALSVAFPWIKLTSLTLLHISQGCCLSILQQASNLVHCEIWASGEIRQATIMLPSLKS
jgi:hypothetical protein